MMFASMSSMFVHSQTSSLYRLIAFILKSTLQLAIFVNKILSFGNVRPLFYNFQ
jgi:hypothetical protein